MKKKLLIVFVITVLLGGGFILYQVLKPVQSVADEKADFKLNASQFVAEYEADENAANKKYLGKVVEISGSVNDKSIDKNGIVSITLSGAEIAGVTCQMFKDQGKATQSVSEGMEITIKGRCTGILMDVVLVDCVLTQ